MNVFRRRYYTLGPARASRVGWDLDPRFSAKYPDTSFHIEVSESGESWTRLTEEPVEGVSTYEFSLPAVPSGYPDLSVRVVAVADGKEYPSDPVSALGGLTRRLYTTVRSAARAEYYRLRNKGAGVPGFIRKVRNWGALCSLCYDSDLEGASDSNCPECFGTGYTGGYFEPIESYMELTQKTPKDAKETPIGAINKLMYEGRCLSYPALEEDDIWIMRDSERRFKVIQSAPLAAIAGVTVVQNVVLEELKQGDGAYQVTQNSTVEDNDLDTSWRDSSDFKI